MVLPGSYDGHAARVCAELSRAVYLHPSEIRRRVPAFVENPTIRIRTTFLGNSRVLIVSGTEAIFVIFRGTVPTSPRSHFANIKILRQRWGNGSVHRGFLRLFLRAQSFITAALRKHQTGEKNLFFSGHSQGGATAYLGGATFRLHYGLPNPGAIYTFGQPRAGNASFTRDVERKLARSYSRIANGRDLVVGVPFVWNGYDHSLEYLHYASNGLISRRRQAPGQGWPFWTASLRDHDMQQYLRRSHVNEKLPPV